MKNTFFLSVIIIIALFIGVKLFMLQKEDNKSESQNAIVQTLLSEENKLDLSNQRLYKVPQQIFSETDIEELNLSNNELTGALPAEIRNLSKLKILDASNNLMTGVPAEIGQLQNLEVLDLSNNKLTGLPYELGNLENLKTFNISGNNYSKGDLTAISEKLPADVEIIK